MNIPQIPTVSACKLMAIFGLFAGIVFIVVPEYLGHRLTVTTIEFKGEKAALSLELDFVDEDLNKLDMAIKKAKQTDKTVTKQIINLQNKIRLRHRSNKKVNEQHKTISKLLNYYGFQIKRLDSIKFMGAGASFTLMFFGFLFWYKKVRTI